MKRFNRLTFLFCGILLTFAAFPVFAQDEAVKENQINRKPLQDFAGIFRDRFEKGEIDLDQPFKVVVEGILTKDGKLDTSIDEKTKKPKSLFILSEGNEKMAETTKAAIVAVNDSGWFGYLRQLGIEKVKLTFAQDNENIIWIIESELPTVEKARTTASGFNAFIKVAQMSIKGEDEKIILSGFQRPTANEKVFTLSFALPKQTVHEMIKRNLNKNKEIAKPSGE